MFSYVFVYEKEKTIIIEIKITKNENNTKCKSHPTKIAAIHTHLVSCVGVLLQRLEAAKIHQSMQPW